MYVYTYIYIYIYVYIYIYIYTPILIIPHSILHYTSGPGAAAAPRGAAAAPWRRRPGSVEATTRTLIVIITNANPNVGNANINYNTINDDNDNLDSLQGGAVGGGCSGWGQYYIIKHPIIECKPLHPVSTAPPFDES